MTSLDDPDQAWVEAGAEALCSWWNEGTGGRVPPSTTGPWMQAAAAVFAVLDPLIRERIATEIYDEHRAMQCPSSLDESGFTVYSCTHLEDAAIAGGVADQ